MRLTPQHGMASRGNNVSAQPPPGSIQLEHNHHHVPPLDAYLARVDLAEGGKQHHEDKERHNIIVGPIRQCFERGEPRDVAEQKIDSKARTHTERQRPHLEETDNLFSHIQSVCSMLQNYGNGIRPSIHRLRIEAPISTKVSLFSTFYRRTAEHVAH